MAYETSEVFLKIQQLQQELDNLNAGVRNSYGPGAGMAALLMNKRAIEIQDELDALTGAEKTDAGDQMSGILEA